MSSGDDDPLDGIVGSLRSTISQRVERLQEEERAFERMKKAFEDENPSLGRPSDVLRLNLGGTRIDVLRRTLTSVEGSMLSSKFSGRWDDGLEKDADGNFFIDVDIDLFLPLISYLRSNFFVTPGAPPVSSPTFQDENKRNDFLRMVEYYDMTLGIFPFGVFLHGNRDDIVAGHPEYKVQASTHGAFELLPLPGNTCTRIKAFEIVLGDLTAARIGWMVLSGNEQQDFTSQESGVGYTTHSIALDSRRAGIAVGAGRSVASSFIELNEISSISGGDVIRCEDFGRIWYVNGNLVASTTDRGGSIQWSPYAHVTPCFSLMGSLRVSKIEIELLKNGASPAP